MSIVKFINDERKILTNMANFLPKELIIKIIKESHPYLFYKTIIDLKRVDFKYPEWNMWVGDLYYQAVWEFFKDYFGSKKMWNWKSKTYEKALGNHRLDRIKARFPGFEFWNRLDNIPNLDLKELRGRDLPAKLRWELNYSNFVLNKDSLAYDLTAFPIMRKDCDYFMKCMKGTDFELNIGYDARRKSKGVFESWEGNYRNHVIKECFTYSYDKFHVIKV